MTVRTQRPDRGMRAALFEGLDSQWPAVEGDLSDRDGDSGTAAGRKEKMKNDEKM